MLWTKRITSALYVMSDHQHNNKLTRPGNPIDVALFAELLSLPAEEPEAPETKSRTSVRIKEWVYLERKFDFFSVFVSSLKMQQKD